jgi:hypothetical protein
MVPSSVEQAHLCFFVVVARRGRERVQLGELSGGQLEIVPPG